MSRLNDDRFQGILLALALTFLLAYVYIRLRRTKSHAVASAIFENTKSIVEQEDPLEAYYAINPLSDFEWESTPPIKLRPFKPNYHLTMGECLNRPHTEIVSTGNAD